MATPTANSTRERVLQLAQEYRDKGFDVLLEPMLENLPDFLKGYHPALVASRGNESVVIEVKSRSALSSASQDLQSLAQSIDRHPGWRFELVIANPVDTRYFPSTEHSLQSSEIRSNIQVAKQLVLQHLESAFIYSWSLVEATLRLVAQSEGIILEGQTPLYLVKQLVIEGIISKSEYQLLMNAIPLRNAIVHGFKTTKLTQEFVYELIETMEQLLESLHQQEDAR
jgi:uncharacterized protein YutE (UPF0331/DUF86 family)